MVNSPPQSIALAVMPKTTAFLSACGSSLVITKIALDPKIRRETMHRIMLGLSICNVLAATWFFASTWPIPEGTLSDFGDGAQSIFGAVGNDVSCNFAGFFNQYQVSVPLFNSTLVTYYFLCGYHGWSDQRIKKIEWLLYTIPISFAVITATFSVAANLIGPVEWTCWIKPASVTGASAATPTSIQRNYKAIQWTFLFGPVWACVGYVTIVFIMLYRKMRALEKKMKNYEPLLQSQATFGRSTLDNSQMLAARRSHMIAYQGIKYVMAFYVSWLFPTITRIIDLLGKKYFAIQLLDTFLIPLQGFLNSWIYLRPSFKKRRRLNPNESAFASLRTVIRHDNS